jgi:hypothetical protein
LARSRPLARSRLERPGSVDGDGGREQAAEGGEERGTSAPRERRATAVLCLVCGLPGAGKSALCRAVAGAAPAGWATAHVEFDAVEAELRASQAGGSGCDRGVGARGGSEGVGARGGSEGGDGSASGGAADDALRTWHAARDEAFRRAERVLAGAPAAGNVLVMADDNFYYRSMRRPFLALARRAGAGFMQVLLRCDVEEALAVNRARGTGTVPDAVITRMAGLFEPPAEALELPGGWQQLKEGCSDARAAAVWARAAAAAAHPLLPSPSPPPCSAAEPPAESHVWDVALRRAVSDYVSASTGGADRAQRAKRAAALRAEFLHAELRSLAAFVEALRSSSSEVV